MASNRFYQEEASDLARFFGDAKRLKLLEPVLSEMKSLEESLKRPLEILDAGAGTGMHAAFLAKQGHHVTAVDPVKEMLAQGEKQYQQENLTFLVDSLPKLANLKNKKFDLIYAIAVWQYIRPEERQEAMETLISKLNPGGKFVIVWPVPMSREHQFSLSSKDITDDIDSISKKYHETHQIKITSVEPIPDPDDRMGFQDKTQKVCFHVIKGQVNTTAMQLSDKPSEEKHMRSKL